MGGRPRGLLLCALVVAAALGCPRSADAQSRGREAPLAEAPLRPRPAPPVPVPGWGRAAGWLGLGAGLVSAAGSAALLTLEDRAGWGAHAAWVGFGLVSVPAIALGGRSSRRAAAVPGARGARLIAWGSYAWVLGAGAVQLASAARGQRVRPVLPVLGGVFFILAQLGLGFDAYASAHQARIRIWYRHLELRAQPNTSP